MYRVMSHGWTVVWCSECTSVILQQLTYFVGSRREVNSDNDSDGYSTAELVLKA